MGKELQSFNRLGTKANSCAEMCEFFRLRCFLTGHWCYEHVCRALFPYCASKYRCCGNHQNFSFTTKLHSLNRSLFRNLKTSLEVSEAAMTKEGTKVLAMILCAAQTSEYLSIWQFLKLCGAFQTGFASITDYSWSFNGRQASLHGFIPILTNHLMGCISNGIVEVCFMRLEYIRFTNLLTWCILMKAGIGGGLHSTLLRLEKKLLSSMVTSTARGY